MSSSSSPKPVLVKFFTGPNEPPYGLRRDHLLKYQRICGDVKNWYKKPKDCGPFLRTEQPAFACLVDAAVKTFGIAQGGLGGTRMSLGSRGGQSMRGSNAYPDMQEMEVKCAGEKFLIAGRSSLFQDGKPVTDDKRKETAWQTMTNNEQQQYYTRTVFWTADGRLYPMYVVWVPLYDAYQPPGVAFRNLYTTPGQASPEYSKTELGVLYYVSEASDYLPLDYAVTGKPMLP